MFSGAFESSIIKRAISQKLLDIHIIQLRDFTNDRYGSVDDHPYGGGIGMILRVDIVDKAVKFAVAAYSEGRTKDTRIILLDPQGIPLKQKKSRELSHLDHLILLCGHYEGIDERIRDVVDEEISIGDYILTGGEIPAMVITDSVARLLPGVLKPNATKQESFESPILEHAQYTRPDSYKGREVPPVLLSGHHAQITKWRTEESLQRTKTRRPDLLTEKKDSP